MDIKYGILSRNDYFTRHLCYHLSNDMVGDHVHSDALQVAANEGKFIKIDMESAESDVMDELSFQDEIHLTKFSDRVKDMQFLFDKELVGQVEALVSPLLGEICLWEIVKGYAFHDIDIRTSTLELFHVSSTLEWKWKHKEYCTDDGETHDTSLQVVIRVDGFGTSDNFWFADIKLSMRSMFVNLLRRCGIDCTKMTDNTAVQLFLLTEVIDGSQRERALFEKYIKEIPSSKKCYLCTE